MTPSSSSSKSKSSKSKQYEDYLQWPTWPPDLVQFCYSAFLVHGTFSEDLRNHHPALQSMSNEQLKYKTK